MSYGRNSVPNRDGQVKFAQTRVSTVEKFYGFFCDILGSVIRKSARLRDKGDIFASHIKEYADAEQLNNTTKVSLLYFAENFSAVQDFRDTEIQRLEARVVKPLVKYGELCKNMKSNIRGNVSAWEREKKQIKQLEKVQLKQPASSPQVAQSELEKATKETSVYGEQMISDIDLFERSKLADMKSILREFVQIEMLFHSKALEYLSKCYEAVQHIDTEADMDQFRNALLEASGLARSFTQTGSSSYTTLGTGNSSSLGGGTLSSSTFPSHDFTAPRARPRTIQRLEARVVKPLVKYGELCKNMKSNIRGNVSAWEREKKQIKQLEKVQLKQPASSPQVAQSELEKATKETSVYGEQMISDIDLFERSKLADMKSILREFVQIEMLFHSKALEYLSKCYEAVQHIDTEADMDQFRNALLEASGLARSFTQTGSSSYTTLGTGNSSSLGGGTLSSSTFPSHDFTAPRARPRTAMYNDADDEDSYENDDDSDS